MHGKMMEWSKRRKDTIAKTELKEMETNETDIQEPWRGVYTLSPT